MYDTERALGKAVAEKGFKPAFLEFLADDAILFRPQAVNGPEFLRNRESAGSGELRRTVTFADISANGLLGYTTGEWRLTQRVRNSVTEKVGHYATVWQKRKDGYKAILDIEVSHEDYRKPQMRSAPPANKDRDVNRKGWSAADAVMTFLRMGMTKKGLGGAYEKFAADSVQLFRDGVPPIIGRGSAEEELEKYRAVDFPARVSQFESADMAYSWNQCSYADSDEGMEKGNCLHVWKLKDNKWRIVLGVFARVGNNEKPVLKFRQRPKR